MKKIISFVLLASMLLVSTVLLPSCSVNDSVDETALKGEYTRDLEGTTLNVFNWGENISDGSEGSLSVTKAFEKLTGIKVNYTTYDDNESMYGKLNSGAVSYDIVIPSDYMIQRLIEEGLVQKVDHQL